MQNSPSLYTGLTVPVLSLTFRKPWGPALFRGKNVENRTWWTDHRGPLGIVVGKGFDAWAEEWMRERGLIDAYPTEAQESLLLGVVTIVDVQRRSDSPWYIPQSKNSRGELVDNWAWILANPQLLAEPYPVTGFLGYRTLQIPAHVMRGITL